MVIIYENIPCPVLFTKESDTFLIFFKDEIKLIFLCQLRYGEVKKYNYGTYYYFEGFIHRESGPAVEYNEGVKKWFQKGKKHRIDGPAVERIDGSKEWWVNGTEYSEKGYFKKIEEMKRDGTYNL